LAKIRNKSVTTKPKPSVSEVSEDTNGGRDSFLTKNLLLISITNVLVRLLVPHHIKRSPCRNAGALLFLPH
ncbi:hypothetical protein, partial [Vibrio cholerae]|uniref:hypothetical protein n=1 Tax=Vibrio cholerae TaxID=666 RepID=UPI001C122E96